MNVELMVLTMNMEARLTMVEDGDGVAEVMNVVTRRGHQPTLAPPPALSISIHRMLPSSSSRAQLWQPTCVPVEQSWWRRRRPPCRQARLLAYQCGPSERRRGNSNTNSPLQHQCTEFGQNSTSWL